MDTEKYNIGWCVAVVSKGGEKSKLVRFLISEGFQKMDGTLIRSCVRGQAGMGEIAAKIQAKKFVETSMKLFFVTRAQWEKSYIIHGEPCRAEVA